MSRGVEKITQFSISFLVCIDLRRGGCVADDVCVCVLAFIYNCSPEDRLPGATHIGVNIAETAVSQDFLLSLSGK